MTGPTAPASCPTVAGDPGVAACAPVFMHLSGALRSGARGAFGSPRHSGNLLGVSHGSRSDLDVWLLG